MTARVFGELPAATMLSDTPYGLRKTFLFILMVALWIGAGLIGRDPWSPQETGFVIFIAEKNGVITGLPESARPEMPASAYPTWAASRLLGIITPSKLDAHGEHSSPFMLT